MRELNDKRKVSSKSNQQRLLKQMGGGSSTPEFNVYEEGMASVQYDNKIDPSLCLYAPHQIFKRDLAVSIIKAYSLSQDKSVSIMTTDLIGLVSLRYSLEIENVSSIWTQFADQDLAQLAYHNCSRSGIEPNIIDTRLNIFLSHHHQKIDVIDLFNVESPITFLEQSIKHIKNKGIILVSTQYQKENFGLVRPNDPYSIEFEIRSVLTLAKFVAARYKRQIIPLVSFFKIDIFNIFQVVDSGAESKRVSNSTSYLVYSDQDFSLTSLTFELDGKVKISSLNGEEEHFIAGPVYSGALQDKKFLIFAIDVMRTVHVTFFKMISSLFQLLLRELEIPFYVDMLIFNNSDKLKPIPIPVLFSALKNQNFLCGPTHFNFNLIKTNAPIELIVKIVNEWEILEMNIRLYSQEEDGKEEDLNLSLDPEMYLYFKELVSIALKAGFDVDKDLEY